MDAEFRDRPPEHWEGEIKEVLGKAQDALERGAEKVTVYPMTDTDKLAATVAALRRAAAELAVQPHLPDEATIARWLELHHGIRLTERGVGVQEPGEWRRNAEIEVHARNLVLLSYELSDVGPWLPKPKGKWKGLVENFDSELDQLDVALRRGPGESPPIEPSEAAIEAAFKQLEALGWSVYQDLNATLSCETRRQLGLALAAAYRAQFTQETGE
jgi:hypothetical protein